MILLHVSSPCLLGLLTTFASSQLEPLLAKGMAQSGPETITETAANPKSIEDGALLLGASRPDAGFACQLIAHLIADEDEERRDDDQSSSSTIRTSTPTVKSTRQTSPIGNSSLSQKSSPPYVSLALPSSPGSSSFSPSAAFSPLEAPMSMAEIEQREENARAAAMERMRDMTLESSDQSREQRSTPRRMPISGGGQPAPSIHHRNASVVAPVYVAANVYADL